MTFSFTLSWWLIPAWITVLGLIWALWIVDDGGGMLSGISNIFALVPVLAISAISWAVAAFLK